MRFIPEDEIEWRRIGIIKLYDGPNGGIWKWWFDLPRPLADWDVYAIWEDQRFLSMERHLEPGMVLFDVGTEAGWCNLVYASIVGPQNMVLIEPTPQFWPNIRKTWQRNYYDLPLACYDGLFSDTTTDERQHWPTWPTKTDGPIIDRIKYTHLNDNPDNIPTMRLDDYVDRTGIIPDALTMDVEGAELFVIKGAYNTLKEHHPLVWISVHPDLSRARYNIPPQQVHDFMMNGCGYQAHYLATDHEQHWFYD